VSKSSRATSCREAAGHPSWRRGVTRRSRSELPTTRFSDARAYGDMTRQLVYSCYLIEHSTTRMGADGDTSVANASGRSHDRPNLWLAGSSLFPTSGTANPTLTHCGARAADGGGDHGGHGAVAYFPGPEIQLPECVARGHEPSALFPRAAGLLIRSTSPDALLRTASRAAYRPRDLTPFAFRSPDASCELH
jgi:hypothetical protein